MTGLKSRIGKEQLKILYFRPNLMIFFMITYSLISQNAIFTMHPVDLNIPGINCVQVFDLDMDGDYDIIGGSEHTPYTVSVGLMWWRNDGGNPIQWTKFVIDGFFLHVMSVDVNDIDGDNFPDVIASSWENGKVIWWKNSGNPESGWTSHDIVSGWINPHDAVGFDIENDGDMDVIAASSGDNKISVFYNQGGENPSWQEQVLTSDFTGAKSAIVVDLNNDGLPDLVGAADGCDDIAWWKNLGGKPIIWEKHYISTFFNGSAGINTEDMDYDGQPDVVGTGWEGNEVSFWICEDIETNSWTKTMVTDQLEIATGALGRDIDMDGDKDIVAVGKIPGELAIFVNGNDVFTKDILFPAFAGGNALSVIDIDQDGDDDIVAGAGVLKELYWFENMTFHISTGDPPVKSSGLTVFPNPSGGKFRVGVPDNSLLPTTVRIWNLAGRLIYQKTFLPNNDQVDIYLSDIPDGTYLCDIQTEKTIKRTKILICKLEK